MKEVYDFTTLIIWMSQSIFICRGIRIIFITFLFHFSIPSKQTVKSQMRRRDLQCLILGYTVCIYVPGLCWLNSFRVPLIEKCTVQTSKYGMGLSFIS